MRPFVVAGDTGQVLLPPALVATDLDGTLLRSDNSVSDRTRAALAAVEAAGAGLVLVTGRPPRWMAPVVEVTGHRGVAVCANGALVYDLHTEEVIRSFLLAGDVAAEVVDALRRGVDGVSFAVERPLAGFGHEPSYVPRWPNPDTSVEPVADLVAGGVVKLLVRHEQMTSDALLAAAREVLGDLVTTTHSSSGGLLEISAAGVSKATTLALLAAERGVGSEEVVAFGDMPNDLPMLSWAGHAVAVADAHREVLAIVDEVTAGNDDDGVALVLERLFR